MCRNCEKTPKELELVRRSLEIVIKTMDDGLSDIHQNPGRDVMEHIELIARLAIWGIEGLDLDLAPTPEVARIGKLIGLTPPEEPADA